MFIDGMATNVLLLCAYPPDAEGLGGTQVVTAALATRAPETVRVVAAYPKGDRLYLESFRPARELIAILSWHASADPVDRSPRQQTALEAALVGTNSRVLHVHSPSSSVAAIVGAVANAAAALAITLHDHALVCENYQLLELGTRYCGIPEDLGRCDRCLAHVYGRETGRIETWRRAMNRLAIAADRVVAPSSSVLAHALTIHPQLAERSTLLPWGVPPSSIACAPGSDPTQPLRVAVVGLHAKVKGEDRLPKLLEACRALDVEWHFFGATEGASLRNLRRASPRVVIHGAYRRASLAERLSRARCDLALFASIAPESFSLSLSEVLAVGLPVIVSNLGALQERVVAGGFGWTFDPWEPEALARTLGDISSNRAMLAEAAQRVRQTSVRTEDDMVEDHARLWEHLALIAAGREPRSGVAGPALTRYAEGTRCAARSKPQLISTAVARLRHTDWYRDLQLRRLLSEKARSTVESLATRIAERVTRR